MQHRNSGSTDRQLCETRGRGSPLVFFVLVFVLSVPFWLVGGYFKFQLLPGLPVSALMAVCPLLAAIILVQREDGNGAVAALLKRSFDHHRIKEKAWYVPIFLLMPAIHLMAYGLMRLAGAPFPAPRFPVAEVPLLFLFFLAGGVAEELGWSGYALDRLQARCCAFQAAIHLGAVSAVWHVVPLAQVDRSPGWIAWWFLSTAAARVLYTWLYKNAGHSVFGAVVFHMMSNVSWQLFPNHGSHYNPRVTGLIIVVISALVTVIWGPKTLARPWNGSTGAR